MISFESISFGEEEFLWAEDGDVMMLLGRGPRYSSSAYTKRMDAFLAEAPFLKALRWGKQVHGKILASLSEDEKWPFKGTSEIGICDGLITDEEGLGLAIWTADCIPLLFRGGGVVAAVHAGWRGIAAGIHAGAIRRFFIEYGVPASEIGIIIGPGVGPCHYEVGGEVIEALKGRAVDETLWLEGTRVDLRALLEAEFGILGIPADSIDRVGPCTACDPSLASFRRDGDRAGRQFSLISRVLQ